MPRFFRGRPPPGCRSTDHLDGARQVAGPGMRTTLAIDDDVLNAARQLADQQRRTVGHVISDLTRQALKRPARTGERNGIPVLEPRSKHWSRSISSMRCATRRRDFSARRQCADRADRPVARRARCRASAVRTRRTPGLGDLSDHAERRHPDRRVILAIRTRRGPRPRRRRSCAGSARWTSTASGPMTSVCLATTASTPPNPHPGPGDR